MEMVNEVVAAVLPDGVTVVDPNVHVTPWVNPVQLRDTGELNPFCGVTDMVAVPLCPS